MTDWLLITAGAVLILKALFSVDVPAARYSIMAAGSIFTGFGLWYRHRRKKRCRQAGSNDKELTSSDR